MSSTELLTVQPTELKFRIELNKLGTSSFQAINNTDHFVAFKVKTTSPKKYCVRPNAGVVPPKSSCSITVTMQAQREMPSDLQCKDKFLIQSVIAPYGIESKDVPQDLFNKENGKTIEEIKLKVSYLPPPTPPSPVPEGSEEGLSPRVSSLENAKQTNLFSDNTLKETSELKAKLTEAQTMLASLTEEKKTLSQHVEQLQTKLEAARRGSNTSHTHFSIFFCFIIGLLGIIIGYLFR
eukprot:TRINITY_DN3087_c0_g1_i1.p1 TRINITY_DN3087_c0_g1~~TRINITY_DN3087_c0_g1_i1.p1  ORF type:complete len:237 (+),score=32.94 TRINITY_DN3087_c0_g1_i1:235-945(+)